MKVSPSMTSKNSRMQDPSKRKLWLMKLSEKSKNVRELLLPRKPLKRRYNRRTRPSNRRPKTKPPRRLPRRLEAKERNDDPSYLNPSIIYLKFKYFDDQNLSSWGLVLLLRLNLVPKYPFKCSTFLMFSINLASTCF